MKNAILVISVIIGTLIGAGFASGKEIELFFCKYGMHGFVGIGVSACFIGIIVYLVFHISDRYSITSYEEFLDVIMRNTREKKLKSKTTQWIKSVIKNIVNLFLLISFFIMVAGFGSYFYQEFSILPVFGSVLLAFLCYLTFMKGISGISKISSMLMPLLIGFIVLIGIQDGVCFSVQENNLFDHSQAWLWKSILYGSYNTILVIPILFSLKKYRKNSKTMSIIICILSAFIIWLLATVIYCNMIEEYGEMRKIEIPMLYSIREKSQIYQYLYGILILVSIYTSAISAGYGFLENSIKKENQRKTSMLLCLISVPISNIGFSALVNLLYPIFGVIGLLQIERILKCLKST